MSSMTFIIIILLIILARYKSILNNKKKKVTLTSLLIWPIVILYMLYSSININSIPNISTVPKLDIVLVALTIFVGIVIGLSRSKFSEIEYDKTTNTVYSSPSMKGLIFLIALIVIKVLLRFLLGFTNHSFLTVGNDCLLLLTVVYLLTMRVITIVKYLKLTTNYSI